MGIRGARRWLVLGVVIGLAGCAPRATIEVEPPVTRTWVGNKPPPEPTAQTPGAAPAGAPGAAASPSTTPTSDAAVVAPAVDPNAPPAANTEPPPPPPAKRSGWVKAGSWHR
jgi:hypothetical protein